jgi:hypothetical protein
MISMANPKSVKSSVVKKEREIAALVEKETRQLKKIAQTQEKELMRVLAFEAKQKELNDAARAKVEENARKEEQRRKEKRASDKQAADDARLRALRRKAQEDMEAQHARLAMQEEYKREEAIREKKAAEANERKMAAHRQEQERQQKREMLKAETKRKHDEQQLENERRVKELEARERDRLAKIELKKLVSQQIAERKKRDAAEILRRNKEKAFMVEEAKRLAFIQKHQQHESLVEGISKHKQDETVIRKQRDSIIGLTRIRHSQRTKEKEEKQALKVLSKIEQQEARVRALSEARIKEQMEIKALRERERRTKAETLIKLKEQQDNLLKETVRRTEEHNKRCEELKKSKEDIMRLRRKASADAKLKKDRLKAVLDATRGGANGIAKIKQLLQSGLEEPKQHRVVRRKHPKIFPLDSAGVVEPTAATLPQKSQPTVALDNNNNSQNIIHSSSNNNNNDRAKERHNERRSSIAMLAKPKFIRTLQRAPSIKSLNENEDASAEEPSPPKPLVKSPCLSSDNLGILLYRSRSRLTSDDSDNEEEGRGGTGDAKVEANDSIDDEEEGSHTS